ERRARYLLTMDQDSAAQRAAWAQTMYRSINTPDFADAIRWPGDVAELFINLRLLPDGSGIDWPGGGRVWRAAFDGDDRLGTEVAIDALLARFDSGPDSGPAVDQLLLREILRQSEPNRDQPSAIRKLLAVSAAIRYQPIANMRRAIPVLVRNYRRFGRAYGFLVQPAALPPGSAEQLVWHLQQIDAIEREDARIDAIRQAQATLMLLHRVLLNDLLTNEDRAELVNSFLDLPITVSPEAAARGERSTPGYGSAVAEWWRNEMVPAMVRGLQANAWPGDPQDLRSVVVTALTGRIGIAELEVDGIDYNYTPASTLGRRMYSHLLLQQQPSFEGLFRLDEIAAALDDNAGEPGFADEISSLVDELRAQMPPNIGDQEVTEALPVTVARDQLFERSDRLVTTLRSGSPTPAQVESFREAVNAYLGDALVGIVYALYMGDPTSFTYQQGHIAWLHRLIIAELGDDGPEDLFGPWAATSESWILDEGSRLHNSLFGAPAILARWNIEDLISGGGARDPAAAEAWAATLAYIHLPSLTPEAQLVVARRHALATTWIQEAVQARDPDVVPSFWTTVDRTVQAPRLADSLRLLMRPAELQHFTDAVRAGRENEALDLVTDGDRYLLLLGIDNYDRAAPAAARWLVDQTVGMPLGRRGDYLGLETPPPVPYGEAGDEFADPLLYTRLFDIRVRLAVLMQERGLPSAMHARLLQGTMARILGNVVPAGFQPWRNLLAAVDAEVTEAALGQQVVDMAFADELTPTDPAVALNDLAGGPDRAAGPSGRSSTLGLPVDPQRYEAQFGAQVDMITVDIGAWDDEDRFVTDLTLDDLTVTSNGQPVTPAFLRLEGDPDNSLFLDALPEDVADQVTPAPRNFVLVADMLTTSPQDWERLLLDVTEFVRAGIGVTDRLALVTIDSRGIAQVTHDFTLDHERIAEILEAQVGNSFATVDREDSFRDLSVILCDNGGCTAPGEGGDITLCDPITTPRFYQCITQQPDWEDFKFRMAQAQLGRWSIEASVNAERVMAAMTQVGDMLEVGDPFDRQKYVILLSSGFERVPGAIHQQVISEYAALSPTLNPMEVRTLTTDLSQKIDDLTDTLKRCHCTVYSLDTLGQAAFEPNSVEMGPSTPVVSRFTARSALEGPINALARDTGGKPFFGSDMGIGFQEVLADTRLRYVLGFTMDPPSPDAEPQWYDIKVTVDRDDVNEVRARDGFWWPRH
ncbi:MAG: VWA domain-containing protein, partial [Acidobacteriota bacterium]